MTEEIPPQNEQDRKRTKPQVDNANLSHNDPVCPYCGSELCEPVSRTIIKTRRSGYSISDACCGICLLGPFGLLCGLCGTGTKTDTKNELVWVCRSCGKEHLSQKDALEKAQVMATSYVISVLLVSVFLSSWYKSGDIHWIFLLIWAISPIVSFSVIYTEISKELGYPMTVILPPDFSIIKYLIIMEVATILTLIFSGSILHNWAAT